MLRLFLVPVFGWSLIMAWSAPAGGQQCERHPELCVDAVCKQVSEIHCDDAADLDRLLHACTGNYNGECVRVSCGFLRAPDCNDVSDITQIASACATMWMATASPPSAEDWGARGATAWRKSPAWPVSAAARIRTLFRASNPQRRQRGGMKPGRGREDGPALHSALDGPFGMPPEGNQSPRTHHGCRITPATRRDTGAGSRHAGRGAGASQNVKAFIRRASEHDG